MTSNSTLQNAVDEFPIPYFSLKDLDCDNVYELFVKEMVNEDYARWHIYTLGENGKLEPLRMEDGREAIFDERNDSEGGFDFFSVCNKGHLHMQHYVGSGLWRRSEDVYEMEGNRIVHSLSCKKQTRMTMSYVCRGTV